MYSVPIRLSNVFLLISKTGLSQRQYKLYNAKQQYIKVSIFTDEAPYIINLSVVRHVMSGSVLILSYFQNEKNYFPLAA